MGFLFVNRVEGNGKTVVVADHVMIDQLYIGKAQRPLESLGRFDVLIRGKRESVGVIMSENGSGGSMLTGQLDRLLDGKLRGGGKTRCQKLRVDQATASVKQKQIDLLLGGGT